MERAARFAVRTEVPQTLFNYPEALSFFAESFWQATLETQNGRPAPVPCLDVQAVTHVNTRTSFLLITGYCFVTEPDPEPVPTFDFDDVVRGIVGRVTVPHDQSSCMCVDCRHLREISGPALTYDEIMRELVNFNEVYSPITDTTYPGDPGDTDDFEYDDWDEGWSDAMRWEPDVDEGKVLLCSST